MKCEVGREFRDEGVWATTPLSGDYSLQHEVTCNTFISERWAGQEVCNLTNEETKARERYHDQKT